LSEVTSYFGKIVSFENDAQGNNTCLSVPQSYWSEYYENRFKEGGNVEDISTDLMFEECHNKDGFGTNWIYDANENYIKLEGNTNYCLTAPYNSQNKAIIDIEEPSNRTKISKCDGRPGQLFNWDKTKNNIVSKYDGIDQGCLFSDPENYAKLSKCYETQKRNMFKFNSLTMNFCINSPIYEYNNPLYIKNNINIKILNKNISDSKYGSAVFILHKVPRKIKRNANIQLIPPVIDNPLDEDFDFQNIHVYVRGTILHNIQDKTGKCIVVMGTTQQIGSNTGVSLVDKLNTITIASQYVSYNHYINDGKNVYCNTNDGNQIPLIKIDTDSPDMHLAIPVSSNQDLKPGTWVLYKNGIVEDPRINYLTDKSCVFLAKVAEKSSDNTYRIIFSVNSTEPRKRYKNYGRPSVCEIITATIGELYTLQFAPLC